MIEYLLIILLFMIPLITILNHLKEVRYEILYKDFNTEIIYSINKIKFIKGKLFIGKKELVNVSMIKNNSNVVYLD